MERVRGRPFAEVMQETVLGPLRLDRTTDDSRIILADSRRALGHRLGVTRVRVIAPMLGAGGSVWSQIQVFLGALSAGMLGIDYFIQLVVVEPSLITGGLEFLIENSHPLW